MSTAHVSFPHSLLLLCCKEMVVILVGIIIVGGCRWEMRKWGCWECQQGERDSDRKVGVTGICCRNLQFFMVQQRLVETGTVLSKVATGIVDIWTCLVWDWCRSNINFWRRINLKRGIWYIELFYIFQILERASMINLPLSRSMRPPLQCRIGYNTIRVFHNIVEYVHHTLQSFFLAATVVPL